MNIFIHTHTCCWGGGASQVAMLVISNMVIVSAGDVRDGGLIPRLGKCPGEGNGNPLQYSCLENPMDGGAWQATVHRVEKSKTHLKRLSMHLHVYMYVLVFLPVKLELFLKPPVGLTWAIQLHLPS